MRRVGGGIAVRRSRRRPWFSLRATHQLLVGWTLLTERHDEKSDAKSKLRAAPRSAGACLFSEVVSLRQHDKSVRVMVYVSEKEGFYIKHRFSHPIFFTRKKITVMYFSPWSLNRSAASPVGGSKVKPTTQCRSTPSKRRAAKRFHN